jgi:hypothetical protein
MRNRNPLRRAAVATAALLGLAGYAVPATAQIGAIGAVPGMAGDGSFAGTPIFGPSAVVLPRGSLSIGGHFAVVSQSLVVQGTAIDVTVDQMLTSVSYAPVDRLMIGLSASPYIALEASSQFGSQEESGHGDAYVDARYQVWRAPGGRTQLAANASLQLPIGDDVFGAAGSAVGFGAAVSHHVDRFSLHGGIGASVPMDEADGRTNLTFSGAGVLGVSPRVWLSLEVMGVTASGDYVVNFAPGARFGAGSRFFLDAGVLLNAAASEGVTPFDSALVVGASFVR